MAAGAVGMASPRGSPPPRPPNAPSRCETVLSFREEQKGPAARSILLGWRLGHLEDDGREPGLEQDPHGPASCTCTSVEGRPGPVCHCLGGGSGDNRAPGQGHPTSAGRSSLSSLLRSLSQEGVRRGGTVGRTQPYLQPWQRIPAAGGGR